LSITTVMYTLFGRSSVCIADHIYISPSVDCQYSSHLNIIRVLCNVYMHLKETNLFIILTGIQSKIFRYR